MVKAMNRAALSNFKAHIIANWKTRIAGDKMAIVDERLVYHLPQYVKDGVLLVLSRFPDHYEDIFHIRECFKLPGKTVINTCEALIVAGLIDEYYPPYAERLRSHPAILAWQGIRQDMVHIVGEINDMDLSGN